MRIDVDRRGDILLAIAKIRERAAVSLDAFEQDEMLQCQGLRPEVQWPQIVALRNILVHEYFGLNLHQVWTMAQKDLPELEERIRRLCAEVASDPQRG
jgi:uncharacterized protein with HEPN domain